MKSCVPAALAIGFALFACKGEAQKPPSADAARSTPAPAPTLEIIQVRIVSGNRTHRFRVELARTPAQQAQGLMFRRALDPGAGMLFPLSPPQRASFWMKNTFIPLDIIFIAPDGRIERIAANTIPHSEENITSRGNVVAVLELAGGRAASLGIKEGDRILWQGGPAA